MANTNPSNKLHVFDETLPVTKQQQQELWRLTFKYPHMKHKCTAVGCKFVVEPTIFPDTNAHTLLFLHALNTHDTRVSFSCHVSCNYRAEPRKRTRKVTDA